MLALTESQVAAYKKNGYIVMPALFSQEEVVALREHFMKLRAAGSYPGDLDGVDTTAEDPLKRFPRMIHMHRWDETSLKWLVDPRLVNCLTDLFEVEPFAVQTMLYFKPPGARGQALHQDQYYLRVTPGQCMAAWLALDDCDEGNGCMRVVPGSGSLDLLCTTKADTAKSFTSVTVPLAKNMSAIPVNMKAGDVLFFNGSVIHGSLPNTSSDRYRRALIGHYIPGSAEQVADSFHPVLKMDGTVADLKVSPEGGPCGVWQERDGTERVEMTGVVTDQVLKHE